MLFEADVCLLQVVQAVEGAVVGLRDQLEALTILDETALTWPGLSLVHDLAQSIISSHRPNEFCL